VFDIDRDTYTLLTIDDPTNLLLSSMLIVSRHGPRLAVSLSKSRSNVSCSHVNVPQVSFCTLADVSGLFFLSDDNADTLLAFVCLKLSCTETCFPLPKIELSICILTCFIPDWGFR